MYKLTYCSRSLRLLHSINRLSIQTIFQQAIATTYTKKIFILFTFILSSVSIFSQDDTLKKNIQEIVISASRMPESLLLSPLSLEQLSRNKAFNTGSPSVFDAIENMKGVHVSTPSLGYKVINARGFNNTTNVRFVQLIDGIDNQAPHIGAPIANALGANDLDIDKVELIPGTASALYGMNTINGMLNIRTKNPFRSEGFTFQQTNGLLNPENAVNSTTQLFNSSNLRYAKIIRPKLAFKTNISFVKGHDWMADNREDLAANINSSAASLGDYNPAIDEVNSYGNESPNRKTLTLNGTKYVVSRTGYREIDIDNYQLENLKGDLSLYYRPFKGHELIVSYKGALINTIYQRSNRFRLKNYQLHQYSIDYSAPEFEVRAYLTQENTGQSYNLRSLAENMDRSFKSDNQWFSEYTSAFNSSISSGMSEVDAHKNARQVADLGRYQPGSDEFEQKKKELSEINNWDQGAALRVRSYLSHAELILHGDKIFPSFVNATGIQVMAGGDYRTYYIIPDGNYFINPTSSTGNLTYSKAGVFMQLNRFFWDKRFNFRAVIRADKSDYFSWKFNPRLTVSYFPNKQSSARITYQSGYRFPSIFEGFSNVNSGGVKRVGGLRVMSNGIFENSYTKTSIESFQAQVNYDVNTNGLSTVAAIEKNKELLKKNTYDYIEPEFVRSLELGWRSMNFKQRLYLDVDLYFNSYDHFIGQIEASIPKNQDPDSIPSYLYDKSKQDKYRLWTNSKSTIITYGWSIGVNYRFTNKLSLVANTSYSKLEKKLQQDGLEDGFNTPKWIINAGLEAKDLIAHINVGLSGRYQSKFDYLSFLVKGEVPSYFTIDAQANYEFKKPKIILKIGGTNILNQSYFSLLGGPSIGGYYYVTLLFQPICTAK